MKVLVAGFVACLVCAPAIGATHHHKRASTDATMTAAEQQAAVTAYFGNLHDAVADCTTIAYKSNLDEDLSRTKRRIDAQVAMANGQAPAGYEPDPNAYKPWSDCMRTGRTRGSAVYKYFITTDVTETIKDGAKRVFVAWLAYIDTFGPTDDSYPENQEATNLREAQASMKADALVSP